MMRSLPRIVPALMSVAALGLAAGCGNPADNVPRAEVAPAEAVDAPDVVTDSDAALTLPIGDESTITWVASKVTRSHDGGFRQFTGEIRLVPGAVTDSAVAIRIDTTSLYSDTDRLTNHLKSADFFEVDAYPTATFASTKIVPVGDHYLVTGNLALHGVTKSITFPATIEVDGGTVVARAEFALQRFDWGIAYKGKADDLIRNDVVVRFDLKAGPPA